jgi:hypothetical protein
MHSHTWITSIGILTDTDRDDAPYFLWWNSHLTSSHHLGLVGCAGSAGPLTMLSSLSQPQTAYKVLQVPPPKPSASNQQAKPSASNQQAMRRYPTTYPTAPLPFFFETLPSPHLFAQPGACWLNGFSRPTPTSAPWPPILSPLHIRVGQPMLSP